MSYRIAIYSQYMRLRSFVKVYEKFAFQSDERLQLVLVWTNCGHAFLTSLETHSTNNSILIKCSSFVE